MKVCFKCGAEKPLSDFYKHHAMADGHVNKCKECNKKDVRGNREANLEYIQEYDRRRRSEEYLLSNLKEGETLESVRGAVTQAKARWVEKNPNKRTAQMAVNNAVRDGRLTKLTHCEHCLKNDVKIQGHHWSYLPENWLDVLWLCASCHGKEHRRLNELERSRIYEA